MREFRCVRCGRKLAETNVPENFFRSVAYRVSIKCQRCGLVNSLSVSERPAGSDSSGSADVKRSN